MPLAYSYIRFSSQRQMLGDSLRRQLSLAQKYAEKNALQLDESLTIRDLGVSGYDRSNIERGALSVFLKLVRDGKVPKGSYLLVEQFDRLSRADVFTAFGVFRDLISAGINLVTLADGRLYDSSTPHDLGSLMLPIAMMFRSHEESLAKSKRIREVWQNKRDTAAPFMTSECPRWLRPNRTKTGYELIQEKVESVRRVFELTANGYGNISIVRRANTEGWPVPGKAAVWHATLVTKLLRNRATLGEYQPMTKLEGKRSPVGEPRIGFYPVAVDEALFLRAQQAKATRATLPRRRDKDYMNVLQGVLRCGCCGASFVRKNKGSKAQPGYVQYLCSKRIIGAESCRSMSALRLEPAVLRHIFDVGFVAVADDDFTVWARDELAAAEAKLKVEKELKAKVIAAIEETRSTGDLIDRLLKLEKSIEQTEKDVEEKTSWMEALGSSFEQDDVVADYTKALEKMREPAQVEYRASLHERILRVVKTIYVYGDKDAVALTWRTGREGTAIRVMDGGLYEELSSSELKLPAVEKH